MEVKQFTPDDYNLFLNFSKDFYESNATQRGYIEELSISTFNRVLDNHENLWGVMLFDKETKDNIGYALLTSYWCNEEGGNVLILDELYIVPHDRHLGYASKFMEWLESFGREHDCVEITLEVLTTNLKAMGLYTKEGYVPDGFTTYTKRVMIK